VGELYGRTINIRSPFFTWLDDDQAIIAQAVFMRLSTRRNTYWTDPEYGKDLTDLVNEDLDARKIVDEATDIKLEVEKDERIASVTVTLSIDGEPNALRLVAAIDIEPSEGAPFTLTLAATDLTIELLTSGAQ
jgi:hypothetical protein